MPELISVRNVTVKMGGYSALSDVSVDFPKGTSTVIMGPSGCGKSTLLKTAAGLIPPDGGTVLFEGENVFRFSERRMGEMRRINGFVFQDDALWENKTIAENLSLPLQVHFPRMPRAEIEGRIVRLLEKGGLSECAPQRPAQLSGGERKIASFLRAVVVEPSLVFLDDPTLSIDNSTSETISQMIQEIKSKGCTIIAVTHDASLTTLIADRLVVLERGRVLAAGEFDSVKRSADQHVRAILAQVLGEIASFDTDLLELLGNGGEHEVQN